MMLLKVGSVVFVDTKGINEGVTFIGTNNMNGAELAANLFVIKDQMLQFLRD